MIISQLCRERQQRAITKSSGKTWLIRNERWKGSWRLCLMWINGLYQSLYWMKFAAAVILNGFLWVLWLEGARGWWHFTLKLVDVTSIHWLLLPFDSLINLILWCNIEVISHRKCYLKLQISQRSSKQIKIDFIQRSKSDSNPSPGDIMKNLISWNFNIH